MTDTANTSTPSEQQPARQSAKTPVARLCPVRLGRIDRFRRRDRLAGRYGIGFAFRFVQNPSWFGVKISSDTLKGTLIEGFEGDKWLIETDGADIKISSFRFDWKPSELTRPSLHITEVVAGDIAIVTKRTPPKEEEPSKGLPDSIDSARYRLSRPFGNRQNQRGQAF